MAVEICERVELYCESRGVCDGWVAARYVVENCESIVRESNSCESRVSRVVSEF